MKTNFQNYSIVLFVVFNFYNIFAFGQVSKLEVYSDKMLLNIYTNHPDANLREFVRQNISAGYYQPISKNDSTGGWRVNDFDSYGDRLIMPIHTKFVMPFKRHSLLKKKFVKGEIQITAIKEYQNLNLIQDASVLFYFKNINEAEIAFKEMVNTLSSISTYKKISGNGNIQKIEFNDNTIENKITRVAITLETDSSGKSNYIVFKNHNSM